MTERKNGTQHGSAVADRIAHFIGQPVRVRRADDQTEFSGKLVACHPLGRDYFFEFEQDGRRLLLKTGAVSELFLEVCDG